jgi:hypothetical protein
MYKERRGKPVDVWDHTNAMGCGIACMFATPFAIGFFVILAMIIYSVLGAWAWVMLPITIVAVPALWIWIYVYASTWTREEASERGREWEWDSSR